MKKFSDMIASGIASREHVTFLPKTPETDPVVRTYNNCYGLFTDTHMGKISEDQYVITGSLCSIPEKFDSFLYSINYGLGTAFRVNGKIKSLSCYLSENGLCGQYGCLNGDHVYLISRKPFELQKQCDSCCGMALNAGCDMPVPTQLGESVKMELEKLLEASTTSEDMQKQLNESQRINGTDWAVFATSNGFGAQSMELGKVILFEAKVEKRYKVTDYYAPMSGRDREYTTEGTLAELIEYFKYTLETGKSYENQKGAKKINVNPKTIQQLCDNLAKAKDNAAANGYGGHSYSWEEIA